MILKIVLAFLLLASKTLGVISKIFFPPKAFGLRNYFIRSYYTTRLRHKFHKFGSNSLLSRDCFIAGKGKISIGAYSSVQAHTIIETASPDAVIDLGNGVSIGEYCHITARRNIYIGNGVLTGRFVLISDNSHGNTDNLVTNTPPLQRDISSKGEIIIEDNVWIGDKATILAGVRIGKGSIVGANAVVTKSIPAYCVVAGNPAKIIKSIEQ